MRNQLLQWGLFIVPWLTLLFMKKNDIKRFMPVALFAAVTSVIIYELGIAFRWWVITDIAYPLHLRPFDIGMFPVVTMWIFKFTHRKFLLYLIVELVMNTGFSFGFLGFFLPKMGISHFDTMSPFVAVGFSTVHGLILYLYQKWQEGIFSKEA